MKTREYLAKLDAWRLSVDFAKDVYRLTASWPQEERFGLTNQVRRASVSVSMNIAEGVGYAALGQRARFFDIANGSASETVSLLIVATELGFLDEVSRDGLLDKVERVSALIHGLRVRASG